MKLKTIVGCVILTVLAATIWMSGRQPQKPADLSSRISAPAPGVSRAVAMLSEGDPAPPLTVSKWIQGDPVEAFAPGTVYLVEFWATWWLPCREVMAKVNRWHHKFKDKGLVVIGQNVKESAGIEVEPFVKRLGNLMSYRIALDAGATNRLSGKMLKNWLFAAEVGIPTAFIINQKGVISFMGHPDEIDDALIEQILAGTFDPQQRALAREDAKSKTEAWEAHYELGKKAWKAKQWDKALSEIDTLEKLLPHRRVATQCLRLTIFTGREDLAAARQLALQLSRDYAEDPFLQHRVARTLANQARRKHLIAGSHRDLIDADTTNSIIIQTALLLMERATGLLKGPEPEFLHTQARLAFLLGQKEEAIRLETEAVNLTEPGSKDQFAEALENFRQGRLPP